MTQSNDKVKQRQEDLEREREMNSVSGLMIMINKPENIHYLDTFKVNGEITRSHFDKRKKDELIARPIL